jgi:1-deoxy-D-xylulose-5-phosphate reductoisomerase
MSVPKKISVLGSTGSIGTSTLDIVRQHPQKFSVHSLSAYKSIDLLFEQCLEFRPERVVVVDEQASIAFKQKLNSENALNVDVKTGAQALCELASDASVDLVMAAIVGSAGLPSSLAAAQSGKRVLLANKESLVMSGDLFMNAVKHNKAELLPIDSEHNAVFQCLDGASANPESMTKKGVKRVILTASGGPFLNHSLEQLAQVTPEQACAHPNWEMGRKISVDSASLMNKGLEVIEACLLFDLAPEQVEVLVHPQSIIHSMVEYVDGSIIAQLANPDMKIPIAYGMSWPERIETGVDFLNLVKNADLTFQSPDLEKFPCLGLAYRALQSGASSIAALNAANEVAVSAFLDREIPFSGIPQIIEEVLSNCPKAKLNSLGEVLALDEQARNLALAAIEKFQA